MDVDFTLEDMAFREEVQSFIEENYPKNLGGMERSDMTKDDLLAWHKILHSKGWVAPSWPTEFGGTGWTVTQHNAIFSTKKVPVTALSRPCPSACKCWAR